MNRYLKISFTAIALIVVGSGLALVFGASTDTVNVPVEQKVIELHMTSARAPSVEEVKRHHKVETMPFPGHATCSGAFIDDMGDILTAKHCVDGFDSFEVVTYDQRKYNAVVVATSTLHDLALIHIDRMNTAFFNAAGTVTRGETIFVLGSPLGITDTLNTGIIARIDGDLLFIDCSALPGNSGGPVFDKDQNLVGILTAGLIVLAGTTHLNIAQGLDALQFFVWEARHHRGY